MGLYFRDLDLDVGEIGGTLSWFPSLDVDRVVSVRIFLALSATGTGREQFGDDLSPNTRSLTFPEETSTKSMTTEAIVTCTFTAKDVVDSVYYNGEDISSQVAGTFSQWSSEKVVSFKKVPSAYLVISAHRSQTLCNIYIYTCVCICNM